MNGRIRHPTLEKYAAIRQFCAARVEEQEQEGEWRNFEILSPQPPSSEAEELVDTFFNVEYYEEDPSASDHHPNSTTMIQAEYYDESSNDNNVNAIKEGVDEGLQLVHLLLACAEAVGCRDAHLADSILSQIWPRVNPLGDSLQRVSLCFATALKSRLSLIQNANPNGAFSSRAIDINNEEKREGLALLHQTTPYIAFGFMAANEAVCEAASGKEALHIVDLGMENVLQWPPLIKALSSRAEGPPKSVRITSVVAPDQNPTELEDGMSILCEKAAELGIRLEHHLVRDQMSPEKLQLRKEEVVFVNSIMQLHKHVKESRGPLKAILNSIKKLGPSLLTVVEQDANHNGPFFVGRFLESLHYYSAMFDSLEACLPRNSPERVKIEKLYLSQEICNVVACEGAERVERHERADQWRRQLSRGGFQVVEMKKCVEKVRDMVGGYVCDGYSVGSEKGCLQLGWKGRPIMMASAWQLNSSSPKII